MQCLWAIKNEKGIAMVLAVSMIGLLSLLGVWMLAESGTAFRVTASMERRESAFNLADGVLQLNYRCLLENALSPSYAQLVAPPMDLDITGFSYLAAQNLGKGTIVPRIQYLSYRPTPPPGWMLNWQGSSSFHSLFHRPLGEGRIPLPASKGDARSVVSALTLRVTR